MFFIKSKLLASMKLCRRYMQGIKRLTLNLMVQYHVLSTYHAIRAL